METKIAISFAGFVAVLSIITSYLMSSQDAWSSKLLVFAIVSVTLAEVMIVERVLTTSVLSPLKWLKQVSRQIIKGNYTYGQSKPQAKYGPNAAELSQIVLAFETMRKRVIDLGELVSQLELDQGKKLKRANDEIAERERELETKNAMLIGKAEELQRTIDELSDRNAELSVAYAKLQKLDKSRTDFLLIAAHELRTPIQPILGFARMAQKGLVDREVAWKSIESEAIKLADMASDILDAGRIESGTFSYSFKPLGVHSLVDSITSSSPKLYGASGAIAIVKELDSDATILGDMRRLSQAFSNLVGNAVKYAASEEIRICTRNDPKQGIVEIKIIDKGKGIDKEILPILFNKFVTKTEANQRGSGLGLYISKSIIENHKGKISAQNNSDGQGATFTVILPLITDSTQPKNLLDLELAN